MRDTPYGADLLAEAWRVLSEDLAPELSGEQRYKALLVASAVAIVRRELEAGSAPEEAERAQLSALLGEEGDLEALVRRLAETLRAGAYDGRPEVHNILLESVEARVRESNPRALGA
jgi:hypothetical protein